MLKNPLAYGISGDQKADDPALRGHCLDLVRQAAIRLAQNKMVNYHPDSGNLGMTSLGRVAAHFYIQAESVTTINEMLEAKPFPTDKHLLRIIASATEFENVRVRQEEQTELDKLQKLCPLKLDGPVHDSVTKSYVLMQAFISREKIKSFTLISDSNYIASNAGEYNAVPYRQCIVFDLVLNYYSTL
jgi:replicative superfamily II helicase